MMKIIVINDRQYYDQTNSRSGILPAKHIKVPNREMVSVSSDCNVTFYCIRGNSMGNKHYP